MGTEMHVVQDRDKCTTRHNNQVSRTLFILFEFPEHEMQVILNFLKEITIKIVPGKFRIYSLIT